MRRHLHTGEYYGAIRRRTEVAGIVASEIHHSGRRRLPPHSHQSAFYSLLLEGDYRERIGPRTIDYRPFSLGFHPPALVHTDEVGSRGGRFFCIEVGQPWFESLRELAPLESTPSLCGESVVWLATRLYRLHREGADDQPLLVESVVAEMLAELRLRLSEEKRPPAWLGTVKELLRSDPARGWTLAALAGEAAVHPVYLSRVFRRWERRTVGDYLNRMRVRLAGEQLVHGEVPLADLALAMGFADQSHFTRVFKRLTGLTPAAFRTALRAA